MYKINRYNSNQEEKEKRAQDKENKLKLPSNISYFSDKML